MYNDIRGHVNFMVVNNVRYLLFLCSTLINNIRGLVTINYINVLFSRIPYHKYYECNCIRT